MKKLGLNFGIRPIIEEKISNLLLRIYEYKQAFPIAKGIMWANNVILKSQEAKCILDTVKDKRPCNFLVYGLGYDSSMWSITNRGGYTLFVEDSQEWISEIKEYNDKLETLHREYSTRVEEWLEYTEEKDFRNIKVPSELESIEWDVILVDAPQGYEAGKPGRMVSIHESSIICSSGTDVFVHDIDRIAEDNLSNRYFKDNPYISAEHIKDVGKLRHLHVFGSY